MECFVQKDICWLGYDFETNFVCTKQIDFHLLEIQIKFEIYYLIRKKRDEVELPQVDILVVCRIWYTKPDYVAGFRFSIRILCVQS